MTHLLLPCSRLRLCWVAEAPTLQRPFTRRLADVLPEAVVRIDRALVSDAGDADDRNALVLAGTYAAHESR